MRKVIKYVENFVGYCDKQNIMYIEYWHFSFKATFIQNINRDLADPIKASMTYNTKVDWIL